MFRDGLDREQVTFKAVRIFVFTAVDLETDLIRSYGGVKALPWNGSGFGSNDPGRERDTTKVGKNNFDLLYPINIDVNLSYSIVEGETAFSALTRLKSILPFGFRFEGGRLGPHPDLVGCRIQALAGPVSAQSVIAHIVAALPSGWQATLLPGYVILYKEAREYPYGRIIAIS